MPIYLPETTASTIQSMTPRQIVAELDKYVVGQHQAKRAVAIALRNRMRRQKLPAEMAEEVLPKNILMIGPTGVGKTEISRRLAKLAQAPFLKVEATKFTEVGYVGRDVEQIVRDLVEVGIGLGRAVKRRKSRPRPKQRRKSACSTLWSVQGRNRPRARVSAGGCARASSTTRRSRSKPAIPGECRSRYPGCPAPRSAW